MTIRKLFAAAAVSAGLAASSAPPAVAAEPAKRPAFFRFLGDLGYPYVDETGNPAYRLFLG